jgi:hypothetical protein
MSATTNPQRTTRAALALVGRARESATLAAALRAGRLVLVTGPRDVGKTALVRFVACASDPTAPVLYVPHARTRAAAAAGLATALAATIPADRPRIERRMKRLGARGRSGVIADLRSGRERGVVFDHVDFPGPRVDELVGLWRERTAIVLVARAEDTLGKLQRHLYDEERIALAPLDRAAAARLAAAVCARIGLQLDPAVTRRLVELSEGLPGLLCRALRLAVASGRPPASPDALVRRARLEGIARERDAIIRGRRHADRRRATASRPTME